MKSPIIVLYLCLLGVNFVPVKGTYPIRPDLSTQLLLSTLDGSLICVELTTGEQKWILKEEPVVKVPMKLEKEIPLFLPDPKDGSLYMMGGKEKQVLQKLPFTIPQLVASSPCRSSDGILYTGKKLDTWFSINPNTGTKKPLISANGVDSTCPREGPDAVFVGRTEYNILMMDTSNNDKIWNVTFFDYASYDMEQTEKEYDFMHYTGSSSGRVLTLNRDTGALMWQVKHDTPVIGIYLMKDRGLTSVPFTSIAESTLDSLIDEVEVRRNSRLGLEFKPRELKLLPTLYVGEHMHGLYALPSLVDQNTATIEMIRKGPLLLEGPVGPDQEHAANRPYRVSTGPSVVVIGHYKVPDYSKTRLQITGNVENRSQEIGGRSVAVQTDDDGRLEIDLLWDSMMDIVHGNISSRNLISFGKHCWAFLKLWLSKQENIEIKGIMIVVIVFVTFVAWRLHIQMKDIQQLSQSSRRSEHSNSSSRSSFLTPEELSPGVLKIGKITLFSEEVLGKGCEGTFVFRGEFDRRPVAVKRVLPECFTFADREVDLLRESDAHPNVVRYYCTEQDKQFRYIALELCAATLDDYVKGTFSSNKITSIEILYQATSGLAHLHSLNIVHRDIKPHNVLLSMESATGEVRAMISDFGLCKKLSMGKASFSRRSGVTGTDGWIAPEIIDGEARPTCAVDIFSLGCVFYFVLSKGKHPFGDKLHRQANILAGVFKLNAIQTNDQLATRLIERMLSRKPIDRPPTEAILRHPFFWNNSRILSFFQDVSDRVEKATEDNPVLKSLEERTGVIKTDWRTLIDSEVAEDLRKYRNYRGDSVRDLLRAFRNKKHHYRELSRQAQKNLGEIPSEFVQYWTSRFPLLLLHSWLTMQCVKFEAIFQQYYDKLYIFPKLPVVDIAVATLSNPEGFSFRKPSMGWKPKPVDQIVNWRTGRRTSDISYELSDLQNEYGDDNWFQQWVVSDFRDTNAYIQWQENLYYRRKACHPSDQEDSPFQPEFPSWEYCEKLRREKRVLEEIDSNVMNISPKHVMTNSPKKNDVRRFRRRPKKTEEPVVWLSPS